MTRDRKASFRDVGEELDRRLGGLLGEVGATLGDVLAQLDDIGDGEILRERNFDTGRGAVRAGIRVRMGGLGGTQGAEASDGERPVDRPFEQASSPAAKSDASASASTASAQSSQVRAIEATIMEIDGTWTLVADLPGIEAGGVTLSDTGPGGDLILSAEGRQRKYSGRFDLPDGVSATDLSLNLVNGILELKTAGPSG